MTDYANIGSVMGAARPVPTTTEMQTAAAQAGYYGAEAQRTQTQNQALQYQNQMARFQFQQQQQFFQDAHTMDPISLAKKWPQFTDQIKTSADNMDHLAKQGMQTTTGSALGMMNGGDYDGAANYLQTRHDADTQAGHGDDLTAHAIDLIRQGTPQSRLAAKTLLGNILLHTIDDKEKPGVAKTYGIGMEPIDVAGGHTLTNPVTQQSFYAPLPSALKTVKRPGGFEDQYKYNQDPLRPGWQGGPGGAPVPSAGDGGAGAPPVAGGAPGTPVDPLAPLPDGQGQGQGQGPAQGSGYSPAFQGAVSHVLANEGGYNKSDMNGAPVNFGINQKANPGVNVANLTKAQATKIYYNKYWVPSGAENLPGNMQAPYFDVYVRNPNVAKKALAQSGGDPGKFMDITSSFFNGLTQKPGNQKYQGAYGNREALNRAIATGEIAPPGGDATASPGASGAQGGSGQPAVGNGAPAAPQAPSGGSLAYAPGAGQDEPVPAATTSNYLIPAEGEPGKSWNPQHTALIDTPGSSMNPKSIPEGARQQAAINWVFRNQLPPVNGPSGTGDKNQAMADGAALMQRLGITPQQLPLIQARFRADDAAYQTISPQVSALKGSENVLIRNINELRAAAYDLHALGITGNTPYINQKSLATLEQVGTPAQKKAIQRFELALNGPSTEYSKFMAMAGNGTGGNPTVAGKQEANELMGGTLGLPAFLRGLDQMEVESRNTVTGKIQQKMDLEKRLLRYQQPGGAMAAQDEESNSNSLPAGAVQIGTKNGKAVYKVPGSKKWLIQQ